MHDEIWSRQIAGLRDVKEACEASRALGMDKDAEVGTDKDAQSSRK
jgi:hypothetical protein